MVIFPRQIPIYYKEEETKEIIMSGFSVSGNIILRNFYGEYRNFSVKNNRNNATTSQLNYADAQALRRAVKKLDSFDFKNATKSELSSQVRAFIDTFNYTMESTKSSSDSYAISTYKGLKNLTDKYSRELANIGIKANSSGYLTLSSSACENISGTSFQSLLDGDSKFMKTLTSYARRMERNIDYLA